MKILQVMLSCANGGAETHFADTVLALHRRGIDQVVVSNQAAIRYADLRQAGVRMALRHGWQARSIIPSFYIRRAIAAERPDIIHCWMRRAAERTPRTGIPTIGWFGGYYQTQHFANCDYFIGVSPGIVKHIVTQGVPRERAFYVNTFSSAGEYLPVSRAEIGTPEDATVLLTLSRLHPKKGIDTALQALERVPDCHLWIAGDGPLEDELKALAAKLGVAHRVKFLGWRTDRGALMAAADVCLLPSRYEPFGTVVLEAWEVGRPLVACAAAGPRETVRDGEDGLVVPIDDVAALATAIRRVVSEPGLRDKLVANGRARYHAEFTEEVTVRRLTGIYTQIVEAGASAARAYGT